MTEAFFGNCHRCGGKGGAHTGSCPSYLLEVRLKQVAGRAMSPAEVRAQKLSFISGQLGLPAERVLEIMPELAPAPMPTTFMTSQGDFVLVDWAAHTIMEMKK